MCSCEKGIYIIIQGRLFTPTLPPNALLEKNIALGTPPRPPPLYAPKYKTAEVFMLN